jgi:DNA-binding cell septation regulator SpoVG
MKINRMKVGSFGKIKAFFDLELDNGIVIKGFKLIEGKDGMFVGAASQKNEHGAYNNLCFIPKDVNDNIKKIALDYYANEAQSAGDVPF